MSGGLVLVGGSDFVPVEGGFLSLMAPGAIAVGSLVWLVGCGAWITAGVEGV
jgi:hypothetical protein